MSVTAAVLERPAYRPTDDEPFMNERQREYFRKRLQTWREDILAELKPWQ